MALRVIKNCEPLLFGPEFAIDNIPADSCLQGVVFTSAVLGGIATTQQTSARDLSEKFSSGNLAL